MLRSIFIHSGFVRRPRLVPAVAGLLVVLAGNSLRAAGDAPAAPTLEEIKGDLKTIKRDNTTAAGQGTSLSKVSLPGLRAEPDSSATTPARPPSAADAAPDGRGTANANWLLKGVELQTKSRPAAQPKEARTRRDEVPLLDASDPAFMLRLYLAQPSERSAEEEAHSRDGVQDPSAPPGVGSFDKFLSQWVSKRDPALRGLIEAASPTPAGLNPSGPPTVPPLTLPEPPSTATANPFLAAFDLNPPVSAAVAAALAAPSPSAVPPASASTPAPADSPARPPAAPPPNPADDKKYFPQLNRF
jgi:hypothetical protein